MADSYSHITAGGSARMHVGAHNDNSNTSTTYNTYHQAYLEPRRGWFSGRSEEKERRQRSGAFLKAVKEKQQPRAEMFYRQGVDIDFVDEDGFTALHWAARNGYMIEDLLAKGFDINARSETHGTPLCLAAFHCNSGAVQTLIRAHADVHLSGLYIPSVLHAACARGSLESARSLIEAGAAVDLDSNFAPPLWMSKALSVSANERCAQLFRATPLACAVYADRPEIVRLLLHKGASAEAGVLPTSITQGLKLENEVRKANEDHLRDAFLKHARYPMILEAVAEGSNEILDLLLDHGANPNSLGPGKKSLLMMAASNGDIPCVKRLLSAGAPVSYTDSQQATALHHAVWLLGDSSTAKVLRLLTRWVYTDHDSLKAASYPSADIPRLLIEAGADVNAKCDDGTTACHWAAACGNAEACRILFAKGREVWTKDGRTRTPLHYAAIYDHAEVIHIIADKVEDIEGSAFNRLTPLHFACANGAAGAVEALLARGADMEARSVPYCETPLHGAAYFGHHKVANIQLERGADLYAKDNQGSTPIDLATESRMREILKEAAAKRTK